MAHSPKKKSKTAAASGKPPASSDSAGPANGADVAAAAMAAGRYKEALEQFKELLKRERRPTWLAGLAAAYAGRAEQLVAKGMVKEALALWRIRSETCQLPLLDGPYIGWLLKAGQIETALSLLPALDKLPLEQQDAARAQLAAAVLVAPDRLLSNLPAELQGQRAAARAAIAACTGADPSALESALQAISFRSPYRDLRPLLKAMALQATDPAAAAASLQRVSAQGPFEPLARALRVAVLPGTEWLAGLGPLDDAGRMLVLELKGCPASQQALTLELIACMQGTAPTPLELFNLLLRHRRALPQAMARGPALRLLVHVPQRLDAFSAAFLPPSEAEQAHLLALVAELKERPESAESHWLRLVKLLANKPAEQGRAALVLRRLADAHALHSMEGALCTHAQDWLEQSLRYDPTDRDTHLRLLRNARGLRDLKLARSVLEGARQWFPTDPLVLKEGVELALAAGAFKKAAALARQLLETDPINPNLPALVGQAHLSHARKLLGTRKLAAAQAELEAAAPWLRSPAERGQLALLRGLAAEPEASGDALLQHAVADLGGPLVGGFKMLYEGRRVAPQKGNAPQDLVRRAGVDMTVTPSATEVLALARALNAIDTNDAALLAPLGAFSGMLVRAAASLDCSEGDHLLICEALHRHGQYDLSGRFAKAALQHWPQRPVFIYLEAAARFGVEPPRMPKAEWHRLDQVFEQARDQGDERTATRLSKLLGSVEEDGNSPWPSSSPRTSEDDDDDEDDGDGLSAFEMAKLLRGGGEGFKDLMLEFGGQQRFLETMREQLGKAAFEQMRRDVNGSQQQLARAFFDMLAAAALLGGPGSPGWPGGPARVAAPRSGGPSSGPKRSTRPSGQRKQLDFFDE